MVLRRDVHGDAVFRRFLVARTVAMAGSTLSLVALPVLVYQLTGSASLTALTTVAESAPYLVLGLPAGALVDGWNRRRVMVVAGVVSGLALLTVPAAALVDALTFGHLLVVATLVATCFVFSDAAMFGVVPQMVGRELVSSATSTLVTISTTLALVGPVVAGVLVTATSPAVVLGIDGACFLLASVVVARLRWRGSEQPSGRGGGSLAADVGEGLRFVWAHPTVRWLTVLGVGVSLAGGATTGLLVVVGVEQLGLADDDARLGWLYTAGAVGSLVASLLLPRLQHRVGVGRITTVGYATALAAVLALSLATSVPVALPALLVLNLALTTVIVNGIVVRQVVTPDRLQSRVNTTARMIAWGGSPLGAGLAGVLAEGLGTDWALRAAGLGLLVSLVGAVLVGVPRYPRLATLAPAEAETGSRR